MSQPAKLIDMQSTTVPLGQLVTSNKNARKTQDDPFIEELAASIRAHGLINPLLVEEHSSGQGYAVIAGNHRLLALMRIHGGDLDAPVPVRFFATPASADAAREASLAENVVRLEMDAADELEAFAALINAGKTVAEVAQRFGVSETVVKKRLALANVSPKVMAAFRAGDLDLDELAAYAVTDDHARQESLLEESGSNLSTRTIRQRLTEDKVPLNDRRVRFLGVEAIEAAGLTITRDLFAEDGDGSGYIDDVDALDDLFRKKLESQVDALKAEGWSWVNINTDGSIYSYLHENYQRIEPVLVALKGADKKAMESALKERADLDTAYEASDDGWTDEQENRAAELDTQIEDLKAKCETWRAEDKAVGGCVIGLDHNGTLDINRGLISKVDAKKLAKEEKKKAAAPAPDKTGDDESGESEVADAAFSSKVLEDLSIHRSSAMSFKLASHRENGLRAVAHALALQTFYAQGHTEESCLGITISQTYVRLAHGKGTYRGLDLTEDAHSQWLEKTPDKAQDLWGWIIQQPHDVLVELIAHVAGRVASDISPGGARHKHAVALQQTLELDMAQYFTASKENLFDRLTKPQLLWAIEDMRGSEATAEERKLKKDALAELATTEAKAKAAAGTPWLPPVLRAAK